MTFKKFKKFPYIFLKPVYDELRHVYKSIRYPPEPNQDKRWEAEACKQAQPYRGKLDNE